MSDLAIPSRAAITEALNRAGNGTVPAMVGLIGAGTGVALPGLPLFIFAASLPMSGLGFFLGLRHHGTTAVFLGSAGMGLAVLATVFALAAP